ncbi:MAG: addiction module antidote protein, HigA family [Methylocystis sp.]|nr:MAG: addiction module antidote protein, HigA family [Methylocystis sp.]
MGRYLEALTRLFLDGAFARKGARPAAATYVRAPVRVAAPRARSLRPSGFATPIAAPHLAPTPGGRRSLGGRPRKFPPPNRGGEMIHPGQILAKHLSELGMTASDLARDIDVPVNRVTAIINGQRGVTADTALRLGHWFGVAAEDWLELQLQYELALARHEVGSKIGRLPRLIDRVE